MYTLITKAERKEGNMAANMGDILSILSGAKQNGDYSDQVFKTGEIVYEGERCCEDGRKYWKWDIEYEEGFKTIQEAENRTKELGIISIIHEKCNH